MIPAKRGKAIWRIHWVCAEMRAAFPVTLYRQRALVETVISTLKRKLGAYVPGRSLAAQMKQALGLGVAYNLYRPKWSLPLPVLASHQSRCQQSQIVSKVTTPDC